VTHFKKLQLSSAVSAGTTHLNDFLENKFNDLIRAKSPLRSSATGNGRFAVATSIGHVRKANEDRCALLKARFGGTPGRDFNVGVVCDGLGGMEAGQEAAMTALASFLSTLVQGRISSPIDRLHRAIINANNSVHSILAARGGTTLTAALVTRQQGSFFCHVGDSRLFVIGPERSLSQVTRDDTMASLLGKSLPDGERDHRLVQFVGIGEEIEPQVAPVDPIGGTYLLTTDGAHDVPPRVLGRAVSAATSPSDLAKRLTQLSDILGGFDNSSVVVMPSHLDDNPYLGTGAEIVLTLPTDEYTILLSSYSDLRAPEREPDVTKGQESKIPPARRRANKPKKDSSPRPKKRSPKKGRVGELPLEEPGVNVEFPDKPEGAE
jgi:PPM family protein phosphatase